VESFPEIDRCCLYLRAEGLRYREIAEVLNISLGGVSLALGRSLARLREVSSQ
jgi:RNA polymerase sigma-70 factor (ECF subfamily)